MKKPPRDRQTSLGSIQFNAIPSRDHRLLFHVIEERHRTVVEPNKVYRLPPSKSPDRKWQNFHPPKMEIRKKKKRISQKGNLSLINLITIVLRRRQRSPLACGGCGSSCIPSGAWWPPPILAGWENDVLRHRRPPSPAGRLDLGQIPETLAPREAGMPAENDRGYSGGWRVAPLPCLSGGGRTDSGDCSSGEE